MPFTLHGPKCAVEKKICRVPSEICHSAAIKNSETSKREKLHYTTSSLLPTFINNDNRDSGFHVKDRFFVACTFLTLA